MTAPNKTVRPLWYWKPGGLPIPSTSKKVPVDVTAYAYEGDTEWTPIEQKPGKAVEKAGDSR